MLKLSVVVPFFAFCRLTATASNIVALSSPPPRNRGDSQKFHSYRVCLYLLCCHAPLEKNERTNLLPPTRAHKLDCRGKVLLAVADISHKSGFPFSGDEWYCTGFVAFPTYCHFFWSPGEFSSDSTAVTKSQEQKRNQQNWRFPNQTVL